MFSFLRPKLHKVRGSDYVDFYLQPGEPIGLRYWCPGGVRVFFGVDIPVLTQIRVWVYGGAL